MQSRPGGAALYGKPFVNFDKLFEVYASDLAKGVKAKGPRDQFEMHEELSSGNVTEATHQFENAVDSHSQPLSHGSIPVSGIKSAACRKRVFLDDGMFASEFSNISKAFNSLVQVEAANAEAMNALHLPKNLRLKSGLLKEGSNCSPCLQSLLSLLQIKS
jgi:phosphoribosylanthranilate isomerase